VRVSSPSARRHAEPLPQADDRDHRPAQVDDPLDERRHLREPGDRLHQDDLADLRDRDRVLLVVEAEAD
jgi:hypothetical protein